MDHHDSIDSYIQSLASSDYEAREAAKEHLLALGAAVVEPLIAVLDEQQSRAAWEAAVILSQIDDSRWIAPMRKALIARNPLLAHAAATALASLGAQSVGALIEALPHAHHTVQTQILSSLGKIGDQQAVAPLMELLKDTPSPSLRYMAIEALGMLGDSTCLDLIRSFQDDENHHVRERVQIALERLGTESYDRSPI